MDKCYDIAEGWAAVEIEYESGGRRWSVMPNSEVDDFIGQELSIGNFLSDVDDTTQWAAAEAYSRFLYNDMPRVSIETERWYREEKNAPGPSLADIVRELKAREVALGLREAE